MTITRSLLEQKLSELQGQFERTRSNLEALDGAMQLARHLLGVLEQPEPAPKPSNVVEFPAPAAVPADDDKSS